MFFADAAKGFSFLGIGGGILNGILGFSLGIESKLEFGCTSHIFQSLPLFLTGIAGISTGFIALYLEPYFFPFISTAITVLGGVAACVFYKNKNALYSSLEKQVESLELEEISI